MQLKSEFPPLISFSSHRTLSGYLCCDSCASLKPTPGLTSVTWGSGLSLLPKHTFYQMLYSTVSSYLFMKSDGCIFVYSPIWSSLHHELCSLFVASLPPGQLQNQVFFLLLLLLESTFCFSRTGCQGGFSASDVTVPGPETRLSLTCSRSPQPWYWLAAC